MTKRPYHKRLKGVAYTLPLPTGKTLSVKESANAWWMDSVVLSKLVSILQVGCSIQTACAFAQITPRQYKYFAIIHPEFGEIVRGLRMLPTMQAQMSIIRAIHSGDIRTAQWWLKKKMPEEYGSPSQIKRGLKLAQLRKQPEKRQETAAVKTDPRYNELVRKFQKELRDLHITIIREKSTAPKE